MCSTVAVKVAGSRARRPRRHRLELEALEGRQVLTAWGPEFVVNTKTDLAQFGADNASSANGMSVAVWTDEFSSTDHDIRAQLYDASKLKLGPEIIVDFSVSNDGEPAVAMDNFGNFVVAWTRDVLGSNSDIVARRYSNTGAPLGDTFVVADSLQREFDPDVAMSFTGAFVVTYTSVSSSTDRDVFAQRYSSGGNLLQTIAVAVGQKDEFLGSVAMTNDGRFDIAYKSATSSSNGDIYLNRYFAEGSLVGHHAIAVSADDEGSPSVSMDNFGNAVVAYQRLVGGDWDIKARRVSSKGG